MITAPTLSAPSHVESQSVGQELFFSSEPIAGDRPAAFDNLRKLLLGFVSSNLDLPRYKTEGE
jgi:hypothetical protein